MFGEVDPPSRWVDRAMLSPRLDTGREREAGDGEADELALTASEAPDGIAQEKDLCEVNAGMPGRNRTGIGSVHHCAGPIQGMGYGRARSEGALSFCAHCRTHS